MKQMNSLIEKIEKKINNRTPLDEAMDGVLKENANVICNNILENNSLLSRLRTHPEE